MRITIVGVGALASLFAARLSGVATVAVVGNWQAQLQALRRDGLTLISPDGKRTRHDVQTYTYAQQLPPAEIVLVLVKSYQTAGATATTRQALAPEGIALTLQNGLGNLELLQEAVGPTRAFAGTTSEGATLVRPGEVRHAGHGLTHLAGERLRQVADLFQAAGFVTQMHDSVAGLIWGKLAINAGINPLTALLRQPNGYLVENPAAGALMTAAANETADLARAQGIAFPYPDAGAAALEVARATARNRSSMLQDVLNGRPTEVEAITGAIVRIGAKAGIPVPTNELLRTLFLANDLA